MYIPTFFAIYSLNVSFLPQGTKCSFSGCGRVVNEPCRHTACRRHTPCRREVGPSHAIWDPTDCPRCAVMYANIRNPAILEEDKKEDRAVLNIWVSGFSKNSKGQSYLPNEEARETLFPKAPSTAVYHPDSSTPPVFQLEDLNLDREDMDESHDDPHHSPTPSVEAELLSGANDYPDDGGSHRPSVRPVHRSVSPAFSPGLSSTATASSTFDRPAWASEMADSLSTLSEAVASAFAEIKELRMSREKPGSAVDTANTPGTSAGNLEFPDWTAKNPWRHALRMPFREDKIFIGEGMGTRLFSELEFFPSREAFPDCFIRLKDESSIRDDNIPKETIILDFQKAQDFVVSISKALSFSNSGQTAFDKRKATFVASEGQAFPFASKALMACLKAFEQNKEPPQLEECKPTSILVPNDSVEWKGVHRTFITEKLDKDVASQQFNERLPTLPAQLLSTEAESKKKLATILTQQCLLESLMAQCNGNESYKVLSKLHLSTLYDALANFIRARRACRQHIFNSCRIPHEPRKLINSCIWGEHLFPDDVVKAVIERAATENKSLLDKWGLKTFQGKRKFFPSGDFYHTKKPRQSPPVAPAPPAPPAPQAPAATSSPATNPRYEAQGQSQSFRQPYRPRGGYRGGRGGKSGGASGRGKGRRNRNKGGQQQQGTSK